MISSFTGEYRFLSNFYPVIVRLDGLEYPSVEHAYQAAKTLDPNERARIRFATTAGAAKRLGKRLRLRDDWESIKLDIMHGLICQKFGNNPSLGSKLLATGGNELVEGNTWGDTFWGVCNGVGQNHLGQILMEVRRSLRQ